MNDSFAAALFFSHLTLVALLFCWAIPFRRLRADVFRFRLRQFRYELDSVESRADVARLRGMVFQADRCAEHLTLTRLSCCLAWAALQPQARGDLRDTHLATMEARLAAMAAKHAAGLVPGLSTLVRRYPGTVELMLESCTSCRPRR